MTCHNNWFSGVKLMQSSRGDTGMGQLDCLCEAHGVFYSGFAKWIVLECEESKRS